MTDTWEPANQLEQQMGEVLRAGDQDAYFRLLSAAELVVPLPKTEPGTPGQPAFTWPTSTHEGRTHILVYTSVEAVRLRLGPGYEQFVRMSLAEVARSWPNPEWWLAVNSGLPIEGYLPAWFIGEITSGRPPAEQMPLAQRTDSAPAAEAFPVHEAAPAATGHETGVRPHAAPAGHETPTGSHAAPAGHRAPAAPTGQETAAGSHAAQGGQYPAPPAQGPMPAPPAPQGAPAAVPPAEPAAPEPSFTPTPPAVPFPDAHHPAPGGPPPAPLRDAPPYPAPPAPPAFPPDGRAPAPGPATAPPAPGLNTAPPAPGLNTAPPAPGLNTAPPAPGFDTAPPAADAVPSPNTAPPAGEVPPPYPSFSTASAVPPAPSPAPAHGAPPLAATAPQPVISGDEPLPAGPGQAAVPPVPPPDAPAPPRTRPSSSDVPLTPHYTADAEFVPLDEEERVLYDAAARDDREGLLRILLGVRQIWVPIVEGGDLMLGPGRPGFQWYTRESGGRTVVPLFTGPSRMREVMGGHPFVLSDLAKVLRFWPDAAWDLVINDGSPIGATIPGERITALSRRVDDDAADRLAADFPAQNDAERRLFETRNDPDARLKTLLGASVFLPVWSRTPPTVQTSPNDPAFPWSAVPVRGRASVLVFTSFDWMKEAVGTTGFVMPTFADLLAGWPEPGWDVSVNPGTPIEIELSGEQIRAIASRPAAHPFEPVPGGPSQGAPAEPRQVSIAPPPEPVAEAPPQAPVTLVATPPAEPRTAPVAGETTPPAPRPEAQAAPPSPSDGAFTIMQKVLAHDQVPWYLDKAYDRVAGFVHRVQDVIDLNTPRRLYECLGLLRDGSPFTIDDPQVHVIRWAAYRSGLYRTPFGGTSEDALKEWGQDGWVVEAPPFTGDGFASGSAGSIPEYKAESFRLPHGSEMYVISSDESERFVARYDADRLVWENEK
ncbi:SseB family protein [Actinoallomurus purpureus]|uniref:SseB family protein n=1 Tax=Actinoallomurus purpureus TaxID=478114 RepID=UPI002093FA12|nr:SseB family protein [Actinoallomurus purpureus]MCO6007052.1 SseB family protein [Actinoallomurus purpureus]